MRIAILNNMPFDAPGGSGRIAGVYADLLRSHGHEIQWWGARSDFYNLGTMDSIARLLFHLVDLRPDENMIRDIRAWHPDVLLTHNLTGCGFSTPKALHNIGLRWVHVLHDVQLIEPSGRIIESDSSSGVHRPWRWFWSNARQAAMSEPDAVISPTKWLLDFHKKYGWFKKCHTEVIPNPVSPRIFSKNIKQIYGEQAGAAQTASVGHPISRNDMQVIYVGRLDRDKGIDLLIDAWKMIDLPSKHLVIVGDGSRLTKIRDMKDSTIDVRGTLSNDQVYTLFAESIIAVVPSRVWENQPTVILEALSAGCRVVAADVGGIRETLGDAGVLVRPCSVRALVEGIQKALAHAADPTSVVQILSRHDPESCVARMEGLLKSKM